MSSKSLNFWISDNPGSSLLAPLNPMLADGIIDRLVHNAHRIEMRGDSCAKLSSYQAAALLNAS